MFRLFILDKNKVKTKEKVAVISANKSFCTGLSHILNNTNSFSAKHCDSSCDAVFPMLYNYDPRVILIDIQFPTLIEIETINCIIDKYPEANILALLPVADYFAIIELVNHGAKGVVTHNIGIHKLEVAIHNIASNEAYFSESVLKSIKDQYYKVSKKSITLTKDEQQLLNEIATATTAAETCERLSITLEEYSMRRSLLFEKTNCTTNSSLAAFSFMTSRILHSPTEK